EPDAAGVLRRLAAWRDREPGVRLGAADAAPAADHEGAVAQLLPFELELSAPAAAQHPAVVAAGGQRQGATEYPFEGERALAVIGDVHRPDQQIQFAVEQQFMHESHAGTW